MSRANELRDRIRDLVREYYREAFPARVFVPASSDIPVAGRVFDEQELELLVDSSLDFWLTTGRFAEQFEREFANFVGVREAVLVNSGSSANLLALTCLTSAEIGRPAAKAGGRSHHRSRGLSDYSQSDRAERTGSRLCRYSAAHLQRGRSLS